MNTVWYKDILQNRLMLFARQYFQDNLCYQNSNTMSDRARIITTFLGQESITKMKQPVRSPECNHTEYI